MIAIDPVVGTYGIREFTAWPVADLPPGPLRLSGHLAPAEVGTAMAVIATYGLHASGSIAASDLIQRIVASECLVAPGGLRVQDSRTGVTANPGCCCGLETWRDWENVPDDCDALWLGHDPSPWVERLGDSVRVWPDGGLGEPTAGMTPVVIRLAELPALIDAAGQQLRQFLGLVGPWAQTLGLPGSRDLAAALDRHFRITGAD